MRKNNLLSLSFVAVIVTFVFISLSCSTIKTVTQTINNQQDTLQLLGKTKVFEPKNGRLMDSLTIQAMDGSFIIGSGKAFKPTFYTPGWVNPNTDFVKAFKYSTKGRKVKIIIKRAVYVDTDGKVVTTQTNGASGQGSGASVLDKFLTNQTQSKPSTTTTTTTTDKSYKVRYVTETLYGLLEFNTIHDVCSNEPTTRAYYISIPENYIQSAKGGNISVVYEYYQCEPVPGKGKNKYTSWVLWLSDIEF